MLWRGKVKGIHAAARNAPPEGEDAAKPATAGVFAPTPALNGERVTQAADRSFTGPAAAATGPA